MPLASSPSVRGEYVVTEKIHGANFSIIVSPSAGVVSFAKRSNIIGTAGSCEDFFSVRSSRLVDDLRPKALQAAEAAGRIDLQIYGELFGGHYPHNDVTETAPRPIAPVQRGIWYSPRLHFIAFDVCTAKGRFMDYDDARKLCEDAGLMFVAPLFRGTLSDCLGFGNRFDSTIPARLGLPPLAVPNLAEGVVIRPTREPLHVKRNGQGRGMFKDKIPQFAEDRRYQNPNWQTAKRGGSKTAQKNDKWGLSEIDLARMEMTAQITEQRLANVLSKIGRINPENKAGCEKLLAAMKQDVLESLADEDRALIVDSHTLVKELDVHCRELIINEICSGGNLINNGG